jgi:hypothetical protein
MHNAKSIFFLCALVALTSSHAAAQTQLTSTPAVQTHAMEPPAVKAQTVAAGPYTFTLHPWTVSANTVGVVLVTVNENGALATDLVPYGGSNGIAELVNRSTGGTLHLRLDPAGTAVSTSVQIRGTPAVHVSGDTEISHPPLTDGVYTLRVHVRGTGAKIYSTSLKLVVQ